MFILIEILNKDEYGIIYFDCLHERDEFLRYVPEINSNTFHKGTLEPAKNGVNNVNLECNACKAHCPARKLNKMKFKGFKPYG